MMAFLQFHVQVKLLQKERDSRKHASCYQLLHKTLMNALQQPHEAINARPGQNMDGIHIAVFLLKRNANLYNVRVTVGGQRAISAINRLLSALESKPVMYCEHQSLHVLSVDLARTPLGSVTTWADLLVPSCQPDLRLHFLTPTIFTGTTGGVETIEQFPQPHCVFSGLQKQWIELGGPEFAGEFSTWLQSHSCFVSDYRLHAKPVAMSPVAGSLDFYTGWKGWITYSTRKPQVGSMSTLRSLARMACFTGTGAYTGIGLGETRIDEDRGYANAMARDQDGF
jgi:CRISPR/Cas system endoribonuclease Cas6 (RAMP superfamily)